MSTASRGANRERQVARLLEVEGWAVTRGAGSKGAADLVALKVAAPTVQDFTRPMTVEVRSTHARLIQVKTDRSSPYAHFGPAERRELASLAKQTGGVAELVWWPPRGECRWIPESEWPEIKEAA